MSVNILLLHGGSISRYYYNDAKVKKEKKMEIIIKIT